MVARAALFGAAFFERHILTPNTYIEVEILTARIRRNELCRSDLQKRHTAFAPLDAAGDDGLNSNCRCHLPMLRFREHLLWRTSLQNTPTAHDEHLIAER